MAKLSDSDFLLRLSKLSQDTTLDNDVRELFINAVQQLQKGTAAEHVAASLARPMSAFAVQQKLNQAAVSLLADMRETYQGWGRRGMGLSLL
ncbi:hypothetical protein PQ472_00345 [Lacticaseibacillus pabuli]|uniref:Bacteriocin immunity protein n=1 Tax=Lacticaseibacillus pabuli TaxID=3025672 RepID=A0ABY7WRB0_9LACO|nr:hypothetical protein [Lacticaseibacillus sp. KACC 23028]WDF82722.1 hypothetical protein PQ472_00345 [Lacticaseibacillus sp. KACC 23028]